jgi:tRNA(His) 5'-end guanylyltransferase
MVVDYNKRCANKAKEELANYFTDKKDEFVKNHITDYAFGQEKEKKQKIETNS